MLRVDQKNNNKPIKTRKRKRSKKKTEAPIQQDLTSENAKREMIEALLLKTDINECDLNVIYDEFYEIKFFALLSIRKVYKEPSRNSFHRKFYKEFYRKF